jgi:hypothetical protein
MDGPWTLQLHCAAALLLRPPPEIRHSIWAYALEVMFSRRAHLATKKEEQNVIGGFRHRASESAAQIYSEPAVKYTPKL